MKNQDYYFDLKGLSEYASLSVRTLREYLSDDAESIPSYCVKRKILVKKSEFDEWIKRHRVNTDKISQIVDEVLDDFKVN